MWALTSGSGEARQRFVCTKVFSSRAQSINTNSTVFICYCTSSQETDRDHLRKERDEMGRNKHATHPWYHLHSHFLDKGTNQTHEHVALFRTNVLDPSQWGTRRPAETSRSTAIPRQFRLRHFSTFVVVCWWELLAMIIMS